MVGRGRLRWVLGFLLAFSGVAAALSLSPEVQQGVTWLQAQVTGSGTLSNEGQSIATPLQNRDEALRTLQLLASGNAALAGAVAGDDPSATEYLARQALSLSPTQDVSALLASLASRQNRDGGVGAVAGGVSSALDSAWTLAALSQQQAIYGNVIAGLKSYLTGQQWGDGGLAGLSQNARTEGSSLMLLAMQALTPDLNTRNSMQQLASWLSQGQGIDGSWGGDLYLTAYALSALVPVSPDGTQRQSAITFLKAQQGPGGDWAGDPFITAVILRALTTAPNSSAGSTPTSNSVVGRVLSTSGNVALSGVSVTLDGTAQATTTDSQGQFRLDNVPTTTQSLTFALAGYQSGSFSITVPGSSQLDMGTVMLSPASAAVTTLSGTVMDVDTLQPVPGATVALNSTPAIAVQTDATGHYQISNLAAGTYGLTLSATGYSPQTVTVSLAGGSNFLQLNVRKQSNPTPMPTGPATLSGQVVTLGTVQALADVQVLVNQQVITTTSSTGNFSLTLPAGTYRLDFQKTGYQTLTQNVAVTDGGTVSMGQVALTAQRTTTRLSGTVTDAQTQKPLANASVQILDGATVSTDATGHYVLDNIVPLQFDIRTSATGYDSELVRLSVTFPSDQTYDFALSPQAGQGVSIAPLTITPATAGLRTDMVMTATYQNAGTDSVQIVPTLQILDANGLVVSAAVPYDSAAATTPLSTLTLAAGTSQAVQFRWNSGQFVPASYTVVARASLAGTLSRTNLLGTVLAERQGSFTLTSGQHFVGSLSAMPPIQQAGNVQPVQMTAVIRNDGNSPSASQSLSVVFVNEKTGATAASLSATVPPLQVNDLTSVNLGAWSNPPAGSYVATLYDASGTSLGVSTKVYIGDAAKGYFTVNKSVVPTGTQTVRANVALLGVNTATGVVTDPLAPLIRTAIQNAVTYNDTASAAWVAQNKCGGCHLGPQAIMGGESNNSITSYDLLKRGQVIGQVVGMQDTEAGGWQHGYSLLYSHTQTATAMWGLTSVQDKSAFTGNMFKGLSYLMGIQETGGNWLADHDPYLHWWSTPLGITSINVHSLIYYGNYLKANPGVSFPWYRIWNDYGSVTISGPSLRFDANQNLYVSYAGSNFVEMITPTGTRTTVLSGYSDIRQVLPRPNGDLYACSINGGLIKKSVNGTVTRLSSNACWGIQQSPAGDIYYSSYYYGQIYKLVNDKAVLYANTPNIHHFAFGRDGNIYYTQWGYDPITRITPDGVQKVVGRYPAASGCSQLVQFPNGNWAVSGPYGVFIMDESFSRNITRVTSSSSYGLEILNGKLLYARNDLASGVEMVRQYDQGHTPAEFNVPTSIDPSLKKAKTWLLAASPVTSAWIQESALQLTALAELQQYFGADTAIAAKLQSLNTQLRSVQNSDGGWGVSTGAVSDPLVTAQVGYALDKLNPSSDDPAIHKAILWMLSKQGLDGSWYSPTLTTHVSTTTWVAIWLPIALNRIGGIDTDLHVSLPANIHLANPTPTPTDSSAASDGSTHYHWSIFDVTSTASNVGFDLTLDNLLPNEQRAAASDAHLVFNNSFTNSQVTAAVDVPVVTASNGLVLALATDQSSYGANTPVAISSGITNGSASTQSGSVHLWVYAQDGTLVSDLGTQSFAGLASTASQSLSSSWNTGLYLPNSYYVIATLYDVNGSQVSTQRQDFVIASSSATGNLLSAQVTTDKGSYGPWDTVQLTDRVTNLTQNALVGNLTLTTRITSSSNLVAWSHVDSISQLTASSLRDLTFAVPLSNAAAGPYTITLVVTDANGVVQAQSAATYLVQSSATSGAGLSGTLALSKKQIVKGDTETISITLTNQGNAALSGLPVTISIVDPVANAVVTQWQDTVPVMAMAGTANLAHSWVTQGSYGSNLVAVLTTELTGSTALAQGVFTLLKPPVTLTYASDKAVYDVNDTAALTSTAHNGAPIALSNLSLTQQVTRPDGTVLWNTALPGQAIDIAGTLTRSDAVAMGRSPAGHYVATLTLKDGDGIALATTSTGFDMRSTAVSGAGLNGSISVDPVEVPFGTSTTLGLSVSNAGNADLTNLPVQLVVTDAVTGQAVTTFSATLPSLLQDAVQTRTFVWTPTGKVGTSYAVTLQAVVNGTAHTLASSSLKIVPPPVKLDLQSQWGGQGRLLVYLSCQPDWQLADSGWTYGQHQDACFAARTATLKGYLDAMPVSYTIVTESDDFKREFRSGRYNRYWLLGAVETLSHNTIEEIREAVFRGDSLLADGGIQRWNNADLYPMLGMTYKGQLSCSDVAANFNAPVFSTTTSALGAQNTSGRPLNMQTSTGVVGGSFANGSCGGANAVIGNAFGRGKTLAFAFDLVGSLPTASNAAPWLAVLGDSLAYTTPVENAPSAVVPGEYLRYAVKVTNQAKAVNLVATVQLPVGSTLMGAVPTATTNADGSLSYRFALPENGIQVLDTQFRAPLLPGNYTTTATVRVDGSTVDYGSVSQPFGVLDTATRTTQVRAALASLPVPVKSADATTLKQALNKYDLSLQHYAQGLLAISLNDLGDTADLLGQLIQTNGSDARVSLDWLLRDREEQWWRECGVLPPDQRDATRCLP